MNTNTTPYVYTTYEEAAEALGTAELDVKGDLGEEALEAGYADIVNSIASMCSPEVAAELRRRKL